MNTATTLPAQTLPDPYAWVWRSWVYHPERRGERCRLLFSSLRWCAVQFRDGMQAEGPRGCCVRARMPIPGQ